MRVAAKIVGFEWSHHSPLAIATIVKPERDTKSLFVFREAFRRESEFYRLAYLDGKSSENPWNDNG